MSKQRVLVTGASGFVGRVLIQTLLDNDYNVIAAVRSETVTYPDEVELLRYSDISDNDWGVKLSSVDIIIHAAARVHVMDEYSTDPLTAFREVNVTGTLTELIKINRLTSDSAACFARFKVPVTLTSRNAVNGSVEYSSMT